MAYSDQAHTLSSRARTWVEQGLRSSGGDGPPDSSVLSVAIGVELLAKAALWRRSPVLLVELAASHEKHFIYLAGEKPSVTNPDLRTAGLRVLLERVSKVYKVQLSDRWSRVVEARNGMVHVGSNAAAGNVLQDSLVLLTLLLGVLELDRATFLGEQLGLADALEDRRRKSVEGLVEIKKQRARRRLAQLERDFSGEAFVSAKRALEQNRMAMTSNECFPDGTSVDYTCPICDSEGRLFGEVDATDEMDVDVEALGNGVYEPMLYGYWAPYLTPKLFRCSVCQVQIEGIAELAACGIPTERLDVDATMLNEPGFYLDEVMRDRAWGD